MVYLVLIAIGVFFLACTAILLLERRRQSRVASGEISVQPDSSKLTQMWANSDALEIVRFAVANMHPATVKGWPVDALRRYTGALKALPLEPNVDVEGVTFAFTSFLKEAVGIHKWRRGEGPLPAGYTPTANALLEREQMTEQLIKEKAEKEKVEKAEVAALTQVLRETGRLASPTKP